MSCLSGDQVCEALAGRVLADRRPHFDARRAAVHFQRRRHLSHREPADGGPLAGLRGARQPPSEVRPRRHSQHVQGLPPPHLLGHPDPVPA